MARLNLVVMDSFKLLFTPMASRMFARGDRDGIDQLYWRNATWIAVLTFPVFAVCFSLAKPLTVMLFGQRYADSGILLAVLSVGCYLNSSFGFNALTLRVYGKVKNIFVNDVMTALVAILLNLALVPKYGALGGAVATSTTLVVQNVLNQISLVRIGAVQLIDWTYARAYGLIMSTAAGLLTLQLVLESPLHIGLLYAALASLFVVRMNIEILDIKTNFPELLRFAPVRRLIGTPGE